MKKIYSCFNIIVLVFVANNLFAQPCDFNYTEFPVGAPHCEGITLNFTDASSSGTTDWYWDFGAGAQPQTSTLQNPGPVNFPICNPFQQVTLVTNAGACTHTETVPIYCNPTACFTANPTSACAGTQFCFNSSCSTPGLGSSTLIYQWDMNNGQQLNSANPCYTYPSGDTGCFTGKLFVTNNHGCTDFLQVNNAVCISDPPTFQINFVSNCQQNSVNFCGTSILGGTPPYTYSWNFPSGTPATSTDSCPQNISFSSTQFYNANCIITDANGCSSLPQNILVLGEIGTIPVLAINPTCGNLNGSIDLILPQGTFSYLWSNDETTQDLNNVGSGIYSVTVTNDSGCTATVIDTLINMNNLMLTETHIDASAGNANGSINLTVNGGTPPYNYLWSNGITTQDINNLSAGNYSVTVTDFNNCTSTLIITIQTICNINFSITSSASSTCDVVLSVSFCAINISGATPPYSYAWTFPGGTPVTSTDSCPQNIFFTTGQYDVSCVLTDANNCSFTVSLPNYISVGMSATGSAFITDATCGNANGNIDLNVGGGLPPINYQWSNGATTQDLTNISAGNYAVTISDNSGCIISMTHTVLNINNFSVAEFHTDEMCDSANGTINISVSNGTAPYSYNWSNGETTEGLNTLSAGNYSVTVTDANNCTATSGVTINNHPGPTITVNHVDASCLNCHNGSATVFITAGGTPPYTIQWNIGSTSNPIINLDPGVYEVCVADANGCSVCDSVMVGNATGIFSVDENENLNIIPNPNNGIFTLEFSNSLQIENIEIINLIGEKVFSTMFRQAQHDKVQIDFSSGASGIYFLQIKTANEIIRKKILINH